jgi:predicted DNA-binding transcriptional regulator YafY
VWRDRRLRIHYRRESSFYRRQFVRLVDPYGLVAKTGTWFLVCAVEERLRVHAVDELLAVEATDETFVRPPEFDLPAFWQEWQQQRGAGRGHFLVRVRVSPAMAAELHLHLGEAVRKETAALTGAKWQTVQLQFDSFEEARTKLLGLGAGVEVETPAALRLSLLDYAQQVVQLYARHCS